MKISRFQGRGLSPLFLFAAAGLIFIGGCAHTTVQAPAPPPVPPNTLPQPKGFTWAGSSLQATGSGKAPRGTSGAQRDLGASNAARVDALDNLKSQIRKLPVGTDQTVGSIMDKYLNVRYAVEKEILKADIVADRPAAGGIHKVQVSLPLQPIAGILQQFSITTDQELPPVKQVSEIPTANII